MISVRRSRNERPHDLKRQRLDLVVGKSVYRITQREGAKLLTDLLFFVNATEILAIKQRKRA